MLDDIFAIFAVPVSTETPVTFAVMLPLSLVNVKVPPAAVSPTGQPPGYASRIVAEPRTKSPTEPPSDADEMVAGPLNDIGPEIAKAPLLPAVRIVEEM